MEWDDGMLDARPRIDDRGRRLGLGDSNVISLSSKPQSEACVVDGDAPFAWIVSVNEDSKWHVITWRREA